MGAAVIDRLWGAALTGIIVDLLEGSVPLTLACLATSFREACSLSDSLSPFPKGLPRTALRSALNSATLRGLDGVSKYPTSNEYAVQKPFIAPLWHRDIVASRHCGITTLRHHDIATLRGEALRCRKG